MEEKRATVFIQCSCPPIHVDQSCPKEIVDGDATLGDEGMDLLSLVRAPMSPQADNKKRDKDREKQQGGHMVRNTCEGSISSNKANAFLLIPCLRWAQ